MKRAFSFWVLILVICIGACPSAMAENVVEGWLYYGDYAYIIENGQATIVGCRGACCEMDWDEEGSGLEDRPGQSDDSATYFNHFNGVWQTVVPHQLGGYPVVAIDEYGLAECDAGDIILPEGLTSIGKRAFSMCRDTLSITVPESVTFIGENAFDDECSATLRVIEGSYAARYAEENGIPYTYDPEYKVFESGNWLYTLVDDAATILGYDANDDIDAYYENDDGDSDDNENAIDIEVPAQLGGHPVTAIKFRAFPYPFTGDDPWGSEIIYGSVTIPDSVTEIVGNPFYGVSFSNINVSPKNPVYEAVDGVLFDKQQKKLIAFPCAGVGSYVIPEGTVSIGDDSFAECKGLTSVTIPDSVTSIGNYAFDSCRGLTGVSISSNVTSIGEGVFAYCQGLTSVTIPDSVTSIGDAAFSRCSSLTSVSIPSSVTSIGNAAFSWCSSLTSVTIPDSVMEIAGNSFAGCGLTGFAVSPSHPVYEAVEGVLFDKHQKKLIAFPGAGTGAYMIPEGTVTIGDGAFSSCGGLTSITIPGSVTGIGNYTFSGCDGLTSVTISDGVTSIGDGTFFWCKNLTGVSIPSSVTSIGNEAFYGCNGLTSITIPDSVTSIGERAFASCRGLTRVTIFPGVTSIGDRAFYSCERLTSVTIPSSVTAIGEEAFQRYDRPIPLSVMKGSFAEQYAKENGIPFVYTGGMIEE